MRLSGRLTPEHADALVNDVLNVTLAGLKTGVALQSDSGTFGKHADEATEYHEGALDHAQIRD